MSSYPPQYPRSSNPLIPFPHLFLQSKQKQKLEAGKIGDSLIKSDMKLGPQTHLSAESQSEGTIQLVPKPWKMVTTNPRRRGGT